MLRTDQKIDISCQSIPLRIDKKLYINVMNSNIKRGVSQKKKNEIIALTAHNTQNAVCIF